MTTAIRRDSRVENPRAALTAAAGRANGAPAGDPLTGDQLAREIAHLVPGFHESGPHDSRVVVASLEVEVPDERRLPAATFPGSEPDELAQAVATRTATTRIERVTEPAALTAAGVCAPYTVDYSHDSVGVLDRPVRDSLPTFVADRGGIQFRRDIDAVNRSGPKTASGIWSLTTDANPQSNTKAMWEPGCEPTISAEVTAVTLGIKFSNLTSRYDPETTAANTKAAAVAHARYAELLTLNSIYAQATATLVAPSQLSAIPDILVAVDRANAYMRQVRRMGDQVRLRTILPTWVRDLCRMDMTRAMHLAGGADVDLE